LLNITQEQIKTGMATLAAADTDISAALALVGLPSQRFRPAGFRTLFATIVSQQISTEAANAIMMRVEALLPQMTPRQVLEIPDEQLREAGLSYRKIEYVNGLAEAVISGTLVPDGFATLTDESVIKQITRLRGFGRWSAEIYLMFSLGRQDIFPADDLALRVALGRLKGLREKPTPSQARKMITHWAPYRSIGALFLWHYYRGTPDI
jgi:DNA-3-methyladenine glycosylase II